MAGWAGRARWECEAIDGVRYRSMAHVNMANVCREALHLRHIETVCLRAYSSSVSKGKKTLSGGW